MKITEGCGCGATLTVEDDNPDTAIGQVTAWRNTHTCHPPAQRRDRRRPGGTSCNPWPSRC